MADNAPAPAPAIPAFLEPLIRRGLITVDPAAATSCCGPRDEDGFCPHRPGHPVYVDLQAVNGPAVPAGTQVVVVENQVQLIAPFDSVDEAEAYAREASWDEDGDFRWWNVHTVTAPDPEILRAVRRMTD